MPYLFISEPYNNNKLDLRQYAAGKMSFPVLQVASLAGEQPLDEATGPGPGDGLPPVAGNTPVPSAVYSIEESSKRSRSAGGYLSTIYLLTIKRI